MKVKNISARLHHVGNVSLAPGEEKEIPECFESSINRSELVEVRRAYTKRQITNEAQAIE
jgi:hypothetical protein